MCAFCSVRYTPHATAFLRNEVGTFTDEWPQEWPYARARASPRSRMKERERERVTENWIGSTAKTCGYISAWFAISSMLSHRSDSAPNYVEFSKELVGKCSLKRISYRVLSEKNILKCWSDDGLQKNYLSTGKYFLQWNTRLKKKKPTVRSLQAGVSFTRCPRRSAAVGCPLWRGSCCYCCRFRYLGLLHRASRTPPPANDNGDDNEEQHNINNI